MNRVKNPCDGCVERNGYCHIKGNCPNGDAYEKFVQHRKWIGEQRIKQHDLYKSRKPNGLKTL